ncbi:MAG TPA: hypothetical protein VIV40_29720 [Kofleriaceae bacterium]
MIWGALIAFMLSHETRCTVRIAGNGTFLDGDAATQNEIVVACKRTDGAVVVLADDAPAAAWDSLRPKLERAHVTIYMRGPVDDRGPSCMDNPLARGCR